MMNVADIEKMTKVLEAMMEYELLLSDFYKQGMSLWTEDQELWDNLALAEIRHAENMQAMKDIITKKKEIFAIGRPFNLIALNTAAAGLRDYTRRLAAGELSREKMLVIARDIEQSVLESNYTEIVKTTDVEYNNLITTIISQTQEHKKIIQEKIAEMKSKA